MLNRPIASLKPVICCVSLQLYNFIHQLRFKTSRLLSVQQSRN